jgi:riboflavin kinase/FMN adenylyltransferase
MEIFRHINDRRLRLTDAVVTMGNFDGLHLGHQCLVRSAVEDARYLGSPSVVLTFEPHPLKILAPERAPKMILSHKDKMQLLQSFGIDIVIIQNFDAAFANLQPETFVREVLMDRLAVKKIWVGKDFRFGKGRKGTVANLGEWGAKNGFEVGVVNPILVAGERVSSSKIRQLLEEGRVDEAQRMLGRCHFISGKVTTGHCRGRELGFPTANISTRTEVIPPDGVYATILQIGAEQRLSVSNIGVNPTFGAGPRTIESFVLDFDGDIYGESVRLSFVKRLRAEKKFASVDQLVAQMHEDVKNARALFDGLGLATSPMRPDRT